MGVRASRRREIDRMSQNGKGAKHRRDIALTERARQLRHAQTTAEARLWYHLRGCKLDGYKFRRQHPLDRFIVDFCCVERKLIVEIDGSVHADQRERDMLRTEALQALGYRVCRWTNDQIEQDISAVLDELRHLLSER